IDPKRLTKEQLLFKLTKRNIKTNETIKKDRLIKELELAIASEIREQKGISNKQENPIQYDKKIESGWALKSKQKYEGDVDKSKRFIAASMLECLKSKVEEGELNEDEIPKLQTI
ncbi:23516_t:CDS:2, partial [Gigaspora margarita]